MIILLGKTLIFWTGILAGIFFVFSFLGCNCVVSKRLNFSFFRFFVRKHKLWVISAFVSFLVHAGLAILANFGVYV